MSIDLIIFYILLIDSIGANAVVWLGGGKWYKKHFKLFSRHFPPTKGWPLLYLILVLWIGSILSRAGML